MGNVIDVVFFSQMGYAENFLYMLDLSLIHI